MPTIPSKKAHGKIYWSERHHLMQS